MDFHDSDVLIDEIKGIYRNLDDMESPQRVHVAQAMCYAYIYSKENNYSWIDVRISYVNLDSEKVLQAEIFIWLSGEMVQINDGGALQMD